MADVWMKSEFQQASSGGLLARRSSQPLMLTIDAALDDYHGAAPLEFKRQLAALVTVAEAARQFLEQLGTHGSARRDGVLTVYAQALVKSDEIVRAQGRRARGNWARAVAATTPVRVKEGSGAKAVDEKYWIELSAPHYAGHEVGKVFAEWKTSSTSKNFAEWVERDYLPAAKSSNDYNKAMKAVGLSEHKVKYLDSDERRNYEIVLNGGALRSHDGVPFHTGSLKTAFSGEGWAIFVMSSEGHVYSHSHITGKFHHSSFLSGLPVVSAGEWAVNDGKVRAVTAKSGHYKPSPAMFNRMLDWLKAGGVNLWQVAAKPKPFDERSPWNPALLVWKNKGEPVQETCRAPQRVPSTRS